MNEVSSPELPAVGTRVRLRHDIDRYPHFIAPKGELGTVVYLEDGVYAVLLDIVVDGAQEWGNEVKWYANGQERTWQDEVFDDLEVIEPGQPGYNHARIV